MLHLRKHGEVYLLVGPLRSRLIGITFQRHRLLDGLENGGYPSGKLHIASFRSFWATNFAAGGL